MKKSLYRRMKDIWQCIPPNIRTYVRRSLLLRKTILTVSDAVIGTASHQEIYDESYYKQVDFASEQSAPAIARSIAEHLKPTRYLDVGCGGGAILSSLAEKGIDCVGLEYSEKGILMTKERGLCVYQFDIESSFPRPEIGDFDVASSFEVGEHIPERLSCRLVELLTSYSRIIVFSAATPGQGGMDHVNEQPHEYWINLFAQKNYRLDELLTHRFRSEWEKSTASWYSMNVMVFKKSEPLQ